MTRHDDTTAPNERDATRQVTPDATQAVSLSLAAERAGVSLRTAQRRVASGEWQSIEQNGQRLVLMEAEGAVLTAPNVSGQKATRHDANVAPDVDVASTVAPIDGREVERLKDELTRERENGAFLRSIIESDRRDMAELRAALRKALEIAPRQLEGGPGSANALEPYSPRTMPLEASTPTTEKQEGQSAQQRAVQRKRRAPINKGNALRDLRAAFWKLIKPER